MALKFVQCLFWIWVTMAVRGAGADDGNATDGFSGDNFANNLFTDITPLLALFGEQFALQFLQECYDWKDHALFAMAPIGAITAMICAIRVGGTNLLRAIIGRARESVAEPEMEFMSSTSKETREWWNGLAVVRTSGTSSLKQIAHVPAYPGDISPESFMTLEPSTQENGYKLECVENHRKNSDLESPRAKKAKSGEMPEMPPNISLNCHREIPEWERWFYALLATVLQLGVIAWSGVTCFSPKWKERLPGFKTLPGFCLLVIGTLLLTVSMWLCAQIVDKGTVEHKWVRMKTESSEQISEQLQSSTTQDIRHSERREDSKDLSTVTGAKPPVTLDPPEKSPISKARPQDGLHIYWIQESSEECVGSFVLQSESRNKLLTSHRSPSLSGEQQKREQADVQSDQKESYVQLEVKTSIAVGFGVLGFFTQFEGLRLINWSCSVAQLLALASVTLLRGLARRNMVDQPSVVPAREGHELDCLAIYIARKHYDRGFTFEFTNDFAYSIQENVAHTNAQTVLDLRIRLGKITKLKGAKYEEALCLANAIELAIDRFGPDLSDGAKIWLRVRTGKGNEDISFDLAKNPYQPSPSYRRWTVCATQLEAALSLAAYCVLVKKPPGDTASEHELRSGIENKDWMRPPSEKPSNTYIQVVGLSKDYLLADLFWWSGLPAASLKEGFGTKEYVSHSNLELRLGFHDIKANAENEKTVYANPFASLKLLDGQALAVHLFSAFMWGIASKSGGLSDRSSLSTSCSTSFGTRARQDLPDVVNVYEPDNNNTRVTRYRSQVMEDIVTGAQGVGLGYQNAGGLILGILAPMSHFDKLPNEFVVDDFLAYVLPFEDRADWKAVFPAYTCLLQLVQNRGRKDRFAQRAVAATLEFILQVTEKPLQELRTSEDGIENKVIMLRAMITEKMPLVYDMLVWLGTIYEQHGRRSRYMQAIIALLSPEEDEFPQAKPAEEAGMWRFLPTNGVLPTDVLGWSELYNRLIHLVRGAKRKERDHRLFMFESDLGHDCDITGQTMLHQFVNELDRVEFDRLLKIVEDINYPNARIKTFSTTPGRNRQQPLHRAAVTGNNQAARYLLQNGAEFNAVDNVGRTALCLAAWHGRLLVCETLVARVGMEINKPDRYGQTALHMAALNGKQAVVDLLLRQTGIEPDNRDTIVIGGVVHECKTPQQLAEEAGHDGVAESIQVYVKKLGKRAGSHMKPFPVDPNASKFGQRW